MQKFLWKIENVLADYEFDLDTGQKKKLERFLLIDPEETYQVYEVTGAIRVWENLIFNIEKYCSQDLPAYDDKEEIKDYLDNIVGDVGEDYCEEYIEVKKGLAYDYNNKLFFSLDDLEPLKAYSWWNGSNMVQYVLDDYLGSDYQLQVELTDSFDLDVWDGSNNYWPSKAEHAILYKMAPTEDITEEEVRTMVLLETWTQFQDDHPVGELLTHEEVLERVRNHPELEEIQKWLNN